MCSQNRQISRRSWYLIFGVVLTLMAAGFSVFVYGLMILPEKLPLELMPPPSYTPSNQISSALSKYQIESAAFKFVMAGVGVMVVGFAILTYINCRYEIDLGSQVVPLTVQRRDGIVLRV